MIDLKQPVTIAGNEYPIGLIAIIPIGVVALLAVTRRGGRRPTAGGEIPIEQQPVGVDLGITGLAGQFSELSRSVDLALQGQASQFAALSQDINQRFGVETVARQTDIANIRNDIPGIVRQQTTQQLQPLRQQVTAQQQIIDAQAQQITSLQATSQTLQAAEQQNAKTRIGLRNLLRWTLKLQQQTNYGIPASQWIPLQTELTTNVSTPIGAYTPAYEAYPQ